MASSDSPKIYAGMLKRELLEVAAGLDLRGVSKLNKIELIEKIQTKLRRPKKGKAAAQKVGKVEAPAPQAAKAVVAPAKAQAPAAQAAGAQAPAKAQAPKTRATSSQPAPTPEQRPAPSGAPSAQSRVSAIKYGATMPFPEEDLRQVDAYLPGLPDGYGEDRIVLLPRDPDWLFTYWDLRAETKDGARRGGGVNLALRLYERRADGALEPMAEHWVQEYTRSWYLRVPSPGQDYQVEIGYRDRDGGWMELLRSNVTSAPPAGPSSVVADKFITLKPDAPLLKQRRQTGINAPTRSGGSGGPFGATRGGAEGQGGASAHQAAFEASSGASVPGSAAGSAQNAGGSSSPQSGPPWGSAHLAQGDQGETEKGRSFWLVAEAELIVFGATEPGARLKVGGQAVALRKDGTFSVRMAFPDGEVTVPIEAVAADGEQSRGLTMRFQRATTTAEGGLRS